MLLNKSKQKYLVAAEKAERRRIRGGSERGGEGVREPPARAQDHAPVQHQRGPVCGGGGGLHNFL